MKKSTPSEIIERTLPGRLTAAQRATLTQTIVVQIGRHRAAEPLFPPEKAKRRRLVPAVERLKRALAKVQAELGADVAADLEQREAMMIRREARGLSAVLDLYDVAGAALAGLEDWERRYRPKRNQALSRTAELVELLRIICRESAAALNAAEFTNVLDAVNAAFGLSLSLETLKKRRLRGTDNR
jgi:hypothetical protein